MELSLPIRYQYSAYSLVPYILLWHLHSEIWSMHLQIQAKKVNLDTKILPMRNLTQEIMRKWRSMGTLQRLCLLL